MSPAKHEALLIEPVRRGDEDAALELMFAGLEPRPRAEHIAKLREQCANGPIEGLWAAYRGRRMVGAMRAQVQAGRTAFVTPGCVTPDEPPDVVRRLLARVVESLRSEGVLVAQGLVETDHGPCAELLVAGGFRHVANLLYLASPREAFPEIPPAVHLEFVAYAPERHERLAGIIERTYAGSLDCVSVDAVRTVDDTLAGYRAAGAFDPARWLVARSAGRDIGCLLLGDDGRSGQWELTYLGVVPEARGRGFGLAMARQAQWIARNAGVGRMVLAVDAANAPAIAVYAAAGFVGWDHRSVYLRVL
jgi:ribosomal protein S18 acetylase RimI-like enzyme